MLNARRLHQTYLLGGPKVRRLFNQAFFGRILVDAEDETKADLNEPYRAVIELGEQERKDPAGLTARRGSNEFCLAPPTGFEPVLPA